MLVRPHSTPHMCSHTTKYVSSFYYFSSNYICSLAGGRADPFVTVTLGDVTKTGIHVCVCVYIYVDAADAYVCVRVCVCVCVCVQDTLSI